MFRCRRCPSEGRLYRGKLCIRCTVADRVATLLDNGTGHIDPALVPLAAALTTGPTPTPTGRLTWLNKSHNRDLLRALATGRLSLTHDGLTAHPEQAGIGYLRALLVHCGALPALDRQLLDFEAWLTRRLAGLAEHPHERLLRQFGLWHQLPRMCTKAALQALTPPARTYAQLEFIHATAFCTWLAEHDHHPAQLGQLDLDRYYTALKIGHRQSLRGFLNWAMTSRNLPILTFARTRFSTGEALTQTDRVDLLRRFVTDHDHTDHDHTGDDHHAAGDGPLRMRVAACVLLLYAQPVTRIRTLTVDDIIIDEHGPMTLGPRQGCAGGDAASSTRSTSRDLLDGLYWASWSSAARADWSGTRRVVASFDLAAVEGVCGSPELPVIRTGSSSIPRTRWGCWTCPVC